LDMKKTVLAITVLGIAAVSFLAGRWAIPVQHQISESRSEREILYYIDPMNPGFRSEEPGIAPCGMPLEPFYADSGELQMVSAPALPPGAVKISTARQQLIGVRVAPVQTSPMTYTLRLYGQVIPDETLTYRINASTDSWIRELSDVTTGGIVKKGQLLARGLAPSYYNAQVTFLIAMDNLDRINRNLEGQTRQNQADIADNQIRMAVQALQNLGIGDLQVEELANTRKAQPYLQVRAPTRGVVLERNLTLNQWFRAGEEFYTIADIGRVWVYADVYEDEARHLAPGMKVKVIHKQMGKTFNASVSRVLPLFDSVSKTLKVRLDVENKKYDLRPDMFVDIEIPITMPATVHVPADALVDSGMKTIVYTDLGGGAFEPRKVSTGWRLGRQVQITSGLMPGERVVVAGNFLIDSESRMRASASAGEESRMSRDPVCGMYVDESMAQLNNRTATSGDRTFFFCMDECKAEFEKDPEKYISRHSGQEMENHTGMSAMGDNSGMPGMEKSWLDLLKSPKAAAGKGMNTARQESEPSKTFTNSLTSRGVVDWSGPKARDKNEPAKDWTGWGRFPGSRYLGMGDDPSKRPSEDRTQEPAGQ